MVCLLQQRNGRSLERAIALTPASALAAAMAAALTAALTAAIANV